MEKDLLSIAEFHDSEYYFVNYQKVGNKEVSVSCDKRNGKFSIVVFDDNNKILKDFGAGWGNSKYL